MSQDTFPFAADVADGTDSDESQNSRRAILIGGGVAAALVVLAGGWFLLGGSGASTDAASAPVPPAASHRVAGAHPAAPGSATLPVAYTARLGRDPFKALYVAPVAVPAGTAATGPNAGGSLPAGGGATAPAGSPAVGTAPVGTAPAGSASAANGSGNPAPARPGPTGTAPASSRYSLKLVSISKPSPQARYSTWLVAGKPVTVLPAQRFGKFGEIVVLAFSQNTGGAVTGAIIQVGDDSPLDVPVGDSVSVL